MKTCRKCDIEKSLNKFPKRRATCKECVKKYRAEYRSKKENKDRIRERERRYNEKNREHINKLTREWRKKPEARAKKREYQREYREKNKRKWLDNANEYNKKRLRKDPLFKLKKNLRDNTCRAFKSKKWRKNSRTKEMLDCTYEEAFKHLESQFQEGMTWENHGVHGWHIDHIIPLASATTEEELIKLCHYTNLQPLWAEDNWSKGDILDYY